MIKPLPLGAGLNVDVDSTTTHDGVSVAYYNCYRDRAEGIRTIPGLELYDDTGTGPGNNVYQYFSKAFGIRFIVSAGRVWAQYSQDGALTEITGSGLTAGVPPAFAEDTSNVFVAANSSIYKITGSTMTALAGNSPTGVTSLVWYGNFLLANGPDLPGDVTYSDDKTNGYALWEVYNNESKPDKLQTILLIENQWIYNLGPETCEVSFTGGNPTNPFELNRGRISSFGTIAKYSPVYDGESLYYLSEVTQSRKVVKNSGGQAAIVSFPIDIPIEAFERVDDAEGFIMAFKGQNLYCLTFPTANTIINEQYMSAVTLAYHIQKKQWLILSRWNADNGEWEAYRGGSFLYIEPWGLKLVGDRTSGKTYRMYENESIDYTGEPTFTHRWRNNNEKEWKLPRTVSLGKAGQYVRPPDQYQCGQYRNRQHEISYSDLTDAGEIFRACVVSGDISHQTDTNKISNFYRYNCKRGTNEFIVNTVTEDITVMTT